MSENFKIRNEKVESILRGLGTQLKKDMPKGMGFCLLMFDYGADGNMFYVGSGERGDVVNAMREFITKNPSL